MRKHRKSLLMLVLMLSAPLAHATAASKFSIVPTTGTITTLLLPSNFSATVSYQVTNNTNITRTLTMVPIAGVSQTVTGSGICGSTFTLGASQSCTLTLTINASQVSSSGINGGPVICKTKSATDISPDPFLCSQPNQANVLSISTTTAGQHLYIANQTGNSVSYCQINPATGLLDNCSVAATGFTGIEGVGFNPAGTLFYTANLSGNTISVCTVNQSTGALSGCTNAGGSGFGEPDAVAFSPDGSIFYTSNVIGGVTACLVNSTSGQLSSCVSNSDPTFSAAADMAINSAGTFAYVANRGSSTISVCNVSGQTVNSCNNLSGSLINQPEGITLSPSGLRAYIANAGDGTVTVCDVLQDGTGLLANCSTTSGQFRGTGNLAFNSLASFAFVPNQLISDVFTCQVSNIDGSLSTCLTSFNTGLNGPSGLVVH